MSASMPAPIFPASLSVGIRRVITGVDATGRSAVMADDVIAGDPRAMTIWAADAAPTVGESKTPAAAGWWPPAGGIRITLSTRKPDKIAVSLAQERKAWPDINDAAGFHASCSADIVIVISGTIWLELDDGAEIALNAGDTLIQNGTRHKWHNHGDGWPIMAVFIVGAVSADGAL